MIYIVSGVHCSGTSMMMSCLIKGGIEAAYNEFREEEQKANDRRTGELHNPLGYWEVGERLYSEYGFTADPALDKMCVKIQYSGLPILAPVRDDGIPQQYKVIFMRRDPEMIRQSYITHYANNEAEFKKHYPDWGCLVKNLDYSINIMHDRKGVDLIEVDFEEVLNSPIKALTKIRDFGVPIDIEKAAKAVMPEVVRHREASCKIAV